MADDGVHLPPEAMSTWMLGYGEANAGRAAKHRLTVELRRVIEAAMRVEASPELDAFASEAAALAEAIEALPHFPAGAAEATLDDSRLLERSGMSGASNPLSPPMHLHLEDDCVRGWAVYGYAFEGPPGCVHGGFVAAAFDDLLGCAQTLTGHAGFTGTLNVRMVRPTPLLERIDYEGRVTSFEGRKILTAATASFGGQVVAEAEGLFITPRAGDQDERMARAAAVMHRGTGPPAD